MRLNRITAPVSKPVSVADVKLHAQIDDSDRDNLITSLIDAAIAKIDGPDGIGYAMVTQTWQLSMDAFPCNIVLPLWPVADDATIVITYIDTDGADQTLDSSAYRLADGVIAPAYGTSWPSTRNIRSAVKVEFTAGSALSAVPEDLKNAIKKSVLFWIDNLEAGGKSALQGDVLETLDRYRFGWMAA